MSNSVFHSTFCGYQESIIDAWDQDFYEVDFEPIAGTLNSYFIRHGDMTYRMPTQQEVRDYLDNKAAWLSEFGRGLVLNTELFSKLPVSTPREYLQVSAALYVELENTQLNGIWFNRAPENRSDSNEIAFVRLTADAMARWSDARFRLTIKDKLSPFNLSVKFADTMVGDTARMLRKRGHTKVGPFAYFAARTDGISVIDRYVTERYYDNLSDATIAAAGDEWFSLMILYSTEFSVDESAGIDEWMSRIALHGIPYDFVLHCMESRVKNPDIMNLVHTEQISLDDAAYHIKRGVTDAQSMSDIAQHDIDKSLWETLDAS
jgi:hypothetical protein